MAFINRLNGKISESFVRPQFDGQEQIADDSAELQAFLNPGPTPLEQLEALITQGQLAMSEAPLPDDIQKEIFDLEVFVQNYYRRNAINLIRAAIETFIIPPERQDVSTEQRAQVEALKAQMLGVFNA